MNIKQLQLKLKNLELALDNDLQSFHDNRQVFFDKVKSIKNLIFTAELLMGGFTFGYLIAPSREKKTRVKKSPALPFKIRKGIASILKVVPIGV